MNKHIIFSVGALFLFCLTAILSNGCQRTSHRLKPYGWEVRGLPSDKLMFKLDSMIYNYADPDSIRSLTDLYCKLSESEDPSQTYLHRRLYREGTALFMSGELEIGDSLRRLALAKCDSSKFPHDYRVYRFVIEQPSDFKDNSARYERYVDDLNAFIGYEDYASAFSRAVLLSQMLSEAGMHGRALKYALLADSMLNKAGLQKMRYNNRANLASCMFNAGDTVSAVRTLSAMVSEPDMVNPAVEAIVKFNIFQMNGDTAALNSAWEIVRDKPEFNRLRPLVAAAVIKSRKSSCTYNEDSQLAEVMKEADDYSYRPEENVYIKAATCDLAAAGNNSEGLIATLNNYEESVDEFIKEQRRGELIAATVASEVNEAEAEAERRHQKSVRALWIILAAVILIASLVTIALILRISKLRQVELLTQLEVEQDKRRHILSAETEPLEFHEEPESRGEGFMSEFIKRYPKVGKTGRRLALYIRDGLETSEIAKEMNIRKESVMQARWRLRRQMELQPEEDLEIVILNIG